MSGRHLWIDASAGIAGDMLLGALIDAGAPLDAIQTAVDATIPGSVRIDVREVSRAGLRALKADVVPLVDDPPHRTWRSIRAVVTGRAGEVFARLARAEAAVHGVAEEDVHFHEVGALDSIADVVGVAAALDALGVGSVSASAVALGSGTARTAHGRLPVPVPAVTELARGWQVSGGGPGELATPTGMALIRTLASRCESLPSMTIDTAGTGAGTRDNPDRPNVVRVVLGAAEADHGRQEDAVLLEANVDDLDPRLWPGVLASLLRAGAADAWLVPILMKKGRPAHTLTVLCDPAAVPAVRDAIFQETSTLGVREAARRKTTLKRTFVPVTVGGVTVAVKIGHANGVIVQAMPEFSDVAALAEKLGVPERVALTRALAAATEAGLIPGESAPVQ
ncbi:nickel pincer cofactor biosynthesis protein LarC [Actinoplanes sp. TBRC 11911]|uniref:nickel pincer cofactor biosynthesis protein LarC n=1 Tax=Actinoplanes sp. TBRC 11911 TaxID=2729386 RepID=UPI00145F2AD3|nr:nickel pincer cofactor biosynthesis protein LarC [Actinoplanes sp. TBRC 11911]NMO51792.1 nickel pincer cofactor biosynthesis protein LarC [Actinoplanes sp. TBRC 11911]